MESPQDSEPAKDSIESERSEPGGSPRIMVLNAAAEAFPLGEQLREAGCHVVAEAIGTGQAFALADSVLPEALVIAADSLEFRSVALATELIRDRQACALILLTASAQPERLAELRSLKPEAIVPVPAAAGLLAAAIQTALDAAAARRRLVSPPVESSTFEQRFTLASARALRTGSRFAVGAVEGATPEAAETMRLALRKVLRETDLVTTRGERLVFLAEDVETDGLDALGRRMARALAVPPGVGAPAIGMALWNSPSDAPQALLGASEAALEEAKWRESERWRVARSLEDPIRAEPRALGQPADPSSQILLQRTVGWLSLVAIGWIIANYAGIANPDKLAEPLRALAAWVASLR